MGTKRKHDRLLDDVASLLETGKFSDFVITCGGKTWNVHKAIICTQSDVFEAATRHGKEAAESKIDLPDDEPEIVGYMLQYMYEGYYKPLSDDGSESQWAFVNSEPEASNDTITTMYHFDSWLYWASRTHYQMVFDEASKISQAYLCERVITLDPDDGRVHVLIAQLEELCPYNGKAPPAPCLDSLLAHAKVFVIADKYLMNDLKEAALEKFTHYMKAVFACDNFYEIIGVIMDIIPSGENAIQELIVKRVCVEKSRYGLNEHPALRSALERIPNLAYWVVCEEEKHSISRFN